MTEVRRRLEHAHKGLEQLERLAKSSFGPRGRSKLLTNAHGGAITVTSISHRLVANLRLDDPLAKVLLELLFTRQARGADGGLFTVIFATALLRGAADSRMPPRVFTALLPEALASCAAHLRSGRCAAAAPFRVSSLPCLLALVHAVVAPKRVALGSALPGELRHVCLLLVQAFVQSIGSNPVDGPSASEPSPRASAPVATAQRLFPGVRMLPLPGPPIGNCDLMEGVILDVPLPPPLQPQPSAQPLVVALYDVSLVAAVSGLGARVVLAEREEEDASDDSAAAAHLFARFAAALASQGVGLLACQKIVPTRLQDELTRRGVLTLPRLSLRHIGAVRRISGAKPISAMTPPPHGTLGRVGGLVDLCIAGKNYLHLLPAPENFPTPAGACAQPAAAVGSFGGDGRHGDPPGTGLAVETCNDRMTHTARQWNGGLPVKANLLVKAGLPVNAGLPGGDVGGGGGGVGGHCRHAEPRKPGVPFSGHFKASVSADQSVNGSLPVNGGLPMNGSRPVNADFPVNGLSSDVQAVNAGLPVNTGKPLSGSWSHPVDAGLAVNEAPAVNGVPVHLQAVNAGLPVWTLLLFGPSESATEELEVVASTALNTLRATLVGGAPRLVAGGGCVEVLLADYLRSSAPPPPPAAERLVGGANSTADGSAEAGGMKPHAGRGAEARGMHPAACVSADSGSVHTPSSTGAGGSGSAEAGGTHPAADGSAASGSKHLPCSTGAAASAEAAEWGAMAAAAARQRRQVREVFACALEATVAALACGGGPSRVRRDEVLDLLRRANAPAVGAAEEGKERSRVLWGWDVDAAAPCEVLRVAAFGSDESGCGSESSSEEESSDERGGVGFMGGLRLAVDERGRGASASGPRQALDGLGGSACVEGPSLAVNRRGCGASIRDLSSRRDGGASVRELSLAVEAAVVVELEKSKLQAMADAVELASALVGIDAVIVDTR